MVCTEHLKIMKGIQLVQGMHISQGTSPSFKLNSGHELHFYKINNKN